LGTKCALHAGICCAESHTYGALNVGIKLITAKALNLENTYRKRGRPGKPKAGAEHD
jgi:hypothetical protein